MRDTGRPELADAPGAKSGSPYVLSAIGGNVIVWLSFPTTLSVIATRESELFVVTSLSLDENWRTHEYVPGLGGAVIVTVVD